MQNNYSVEINQPMHLEQTKLDISKTYDKPKLRSISPTMKNKQILDIYNGH